MELTGAPQELWKPEELGEILSHQLKMSASTDSFGSADQPGSDPTAQSLRQLLNDPHPSIDLLNKIRRAAKADCNSDAALLPRDTALVIYYACIAAALVRLGQKISDLDDTKLSQAFSWVLRRRWLDSGLMDLFTQAAAAIAAK
jgi:hypothetical protein